MTITIILRQPNGSEDFKIITKEKWLAGESIQSLVASAGIAIGGVCGGIGLCTTCRISVLSQTDSLTGLTREEKSFREKNLLKENERLACQCSPTADVSILFDV